MFLAVFFLIFPLVQVNSLNAVLRGQSVIYGISTLTNSSDNSFTCFWDLQTLSQAVDDQKVWAIKALDASGEPESGFLYGNNLWLGSHVQCMDISNTKKLEVSYEKIQHQKTPYDFPPYPMSFAMVYLKHNSTLQHHTQLPLEFTIQLGLCLPKSCSTAQIHELMGTYLSKNYLEMANLHQLHLHVTAVKTLREDILWLLKMPKTVILLSLLGVVFLLTIVGTVYDVKKHNLEKNMIAGNNANISQGKSRGTSVSTTELVTDTTVMENTVRHSTFGEILKCFSFYSNVKCLVKTTLPSDSIATIHGLRFFGMLWVIMVHAVFYQADFLENVPFAYRLSESIFSQILTNSTYCVDTYLFLSGFLVAYLFFKSKSNQTPSEKPVNYWAKISEFLMMCVNRFLRLTPPYIFIIILTDVMYTYYRQSSSLLSSEEPDVLCGQYWWRNLLYINNLFPRSEMCLSWSWYLSIDTQFFTVSTFLLILSTITFKLSAALVLLLIILNVVATTYKSYSIGYIPTMDEQLQQLDAIYDLPWNRIGPYLVGVITGYILIVKLQKKLVLKERTRVLLWIVFPLLNLWILFTLYTRQLSLEFSAVYMGVSRTLWGIGLGWLLIACCTGNARLLEKFLSFKGWIPLSRLTYCAYLMNPLVANMIYMGSDSSFNASLAGFAVTILGITMVTFYLAFAFSMILESPFILLTKLIVNKITNKTKKTQDIPHQTA